MAAYYTDLGYTPAISFKDCVDHEPDLEGLAYAEMTGEAPILCCTTCGAVWDDEEGDFTAPTYLTHAEFHRAFLSDTANYCAGRW